MLVNELKQGGILALIDYDNTIFDNMTLPKDEDDNELVNLQEIVDTILFKYGNTPLFCPDPAVMKYYIALWSSRRVKLWERFYEVASAEYNPIENYDRTEEHTTDFTPGAAYENLISADNATDYQPDTKRQPTGDGFDRTKIDSHIHGNIGVTTAAYMQQEVINLIPRLDLINFIAEDWHAEFNLGIY